MLKIYFIGLFLFTQLPLLAGGGWTQSKGGLYLKFAQQWVNYDQYYSLEGEVVNDVTRSFGTTSIYAEYGITDRVTAILYFPFFRKSTIFEQQNATTGAILTEGESFSSIGDTNLTFKYGLIRNKPIVVSGSLTLGLPFGRTGQGTDGSLQTGDGEFNQMIGVDLSSSFRFGKVFPYVSINTGFNNRTKGFSDEFRYGIEAGVTLGRLSLMIKMFGVESLNNGSIDDDLFFEGLLANNSEYFIVSPELSFELGSAWGLSFNYAKALSGQLIYIQPSYTLGVYLDLNLSKNETK